LASAFISSITAAIAVLNCLRRSISSLTFWMVWCSWRRRSFWAASVVQLAAGQAGDHAALHMLVGQLPQPLQEAVRALDAGVRPFQALLRRRGEHHEQARGVGAVLVDQRLRVDAVVLRLRHLLGAADRHRLAVGR
jgi:hypothetical protein